MKTKFKHKAIGENISDRQRLTEIVTHKEAILRSPPVDNADLYDTKNLPENVLNAIHKNGLFDKLQNCPKCLILIPQGKDLIPRILQWVNRHGKVVTHGEYVFKDLKLKK